MPPVNAPSRHFAPPGPDRPRPTGPGVREHREIDEASAEAGSSYVVVDTGFWIFGKKRLIPARAIDRIDLEGRKVHVSMTKDQIKDTPDFDEARHGQPEYRSSVGDDCSGF